MHNSSLNVKNISFPEFIISTLNQNLWLACGERVKCQRGGDMHPEIITFIIL